jgi:hypothetical protein
MDFLESSFYLYVLNVHLIGGQASRVVTTSAIAVTLAAVLYVSLI